MKGKITEDLQIEYVKEKTVHIGQLYIGEELAMTKIPIPEDNHTYAKEHIGEEVEFIIWEGGRGEKTSPVAWIQIRPPRYTMYVPFGQKHVLFENITAEQKNVLDLYSQLLISEPRKGTQTIDYDNKY